MLRETIHFKQHVYEVLSMGMEATMYGPHAIRAGGCVVEKACFLQMKSSHHMKPYLRNYRPESAAFIANAMAARCLVWELGAWL